MVTQKHILLVEIRYTDKETQVITPIRLTSAPFNVQHADVEWVAAGDLLSIGDYESNYELITDGIEIQLSGVNGAYQSIIETHGFRNAPVDVLIATLDEASNIVSSATYYHRGFAMSPMTEYNDADGTITVAFETESAFKNLKRTNRLMTTSIAHHQALHPKDMFFQYTADSALGEETWKERS